MTNTTRKVVLGDTWEYFDSNEGWVRWRVDEIHQDGTGTLRKQSGVDAGFPARDYPLDSMPKSSRWRWSAGQAQPDVLFACPHCGENKPISEGDYICVDCRAELG